MKTMSWVLEEPEKMVLREFDVPEVQEDGLLMRVTTTSICGSDPGYYYGRDNRDCLPMILGHEVVGVVEKAGEKAIAEYGVHEGDRIVIEPYRNCGHCDYCESGFYQLCRHGEIYGCSMTCAKGNHLYGGYGQYMYLEAGSHIYKINDGIPDNAAVFASVIGNGFRMMKTKGQVKPTDTVVIWGPGALGLCGLVAAKELQARQIIVIGLRQDASRLELAKELGADHIIFSDEQNAVEEVGKLTGGDMAEVVVECTGFSPIYNQVIDTVRKTGTLVMLGLNGRKDCPLWTDKIIKREITVKGCVGQPNNCEDAMKVINKGTYPIEKMATHSFPMSQANEAFLFSVSKDPGLIRVVLKNE